MSLHFSTGCTSKIVHIENIKKRTRTSDSMGYDRNEIGKSIKNDNLQ